ncbi:MAG: glycogen debranching enzyme family protein [Sedimentisphaerales bacterium]|nr:glycogen debranching enzyme family protein [Sedimentisphaerales bacterium]
MLQIAAEIKKAQQDRDTVDRYAHLLETEWMLSNKRGSFACGTLSGCNTRRYHALLIGSLTPPAQRIVTLSGCVETVTTKNHSYELSHYQFDPPSDKIPEPFPGEVKQDIGVHFKYETEQFGLTKSIYLLPDADVAAICYDFKDIEEEFDFCIRPMVAMRDYHALKKADQGDFCLEWYDEFLAVRNKNCTGQLLFSSEETSFIEQQQFWYNFFYQREKQRGYDYTEDLFSPGIFRRTINAPVRIVLWAGFGGDDMQKTMSRLDVDVIIDDLTLQHKHIEENLKDKDPLVHSLALAGDEFIIDRYTDEAKTKSILAGLPWFMDWGRDAFIAFEGLLLCCQRFDDAASVLLNFAYHADEGMIPNCFGDYRSGAQFNSIDSSLWFIHAAFRYYKLSGDVRTFSSKLMPTIRWIIDSYCKGTKFDIKADDDGLITGGGIDTQLTWMDAKIGDLAVTPRWGKAVEINALWYNAICNCAEFYRSKDAVLARQFSQMADRTATSFRSCFWYDDGQYLYDCVRDDFKDASVRPNQIFAVSLPFSPLTIQQQQAVVKCVEEDLLTPFGLRTLAPGDPRYKGRYEGDTEQRDNAYHQGTVWPWLMGPFIEAYLKVHSYDKQSKKRCSALLEPLIRHFKDDGCINSVSEIFDGDEPQRPRGAFAQAWSVAELLRAYLLVNS